MHRVCLTAVQPWAAKEIQADPSNFRVLIPALKPGGYAEPSNGQVSGYLRLCHFTDMVTPSWLLEFPILRTTGTE
jgi:hypothetical protein